MLDLKIQFIWAAVIAILSVWVIWRLRRCYAETSTNNLGHCWHSNENVSDMTDITQVICCECGLEHDFLEKVAISGHGKFSPQQTYNYDLPEGDCPAKLPMVADPMYGETI